MTVIYGLLAANLRNIRKDIEQRQRAVNDTIAALPDTDTDYAHTLIEYQRFLELVLAMIGGYASGMIEKHGDEVDAVRKGKL